ncbi:hypothetical protein KC19_VG085500 [Ceratodon purpureus]|uniref:Secreted protein n=1 Tax=Ceratodon purpureus TaxID=3225 RepID=A0A8T0HNE4_CERPU|nr:hypothetical protein KC19_VG085500 [Ceratodon purpureus]
MKFLLCSTLSTLAVTLKSVKSVKRRICTSEITLQDSPHVISSYKSSISLKVAYASCKLALQPQHNSYTPQTRATTP